MDSYREFRKRWQVVHLSIASCCPYRAIEHFVRKQRESVNITKDDGYVPLHLAALNDHLDVVTALAEMVPKHHTCTCRSIIIVLDFVQYFLLFYDLCPCFLIIWLVGVVGGSVVWSGAHDQDSCSWCSMTTS